MIGRELLVLVVVLVTRVVSTADELDMEVCAASMHPHIHTHLILQLCPKVDCSLFPHLFAPHK